MTAKTKNSRRNKPETLQKICVYPSITQGPRPAPRNLSFPKLITGRQKKANFKMYHIFVLLTFVFPASFWLVKFKLATNKLRQLRSGL